MQADTAPVIPRPSLARSIPHHLESLAITFTCCVLQSIVMLGFRLDSWIHEAARFLAHYEAASWTARFPVHFAIGALFCFTLIIVAIARRHREADNDQ